ncbi:MAG: DUF2802 domain-containing protein [Pseudomonadota bacterium]
MTEQEILLALSAIVAVIALALILMAAAVINLKRQLRELRAFVDRNNDDIAGLCAAAASMNHRFDSREQVIDRLAEKISQLDYGFPQNHRYGDAIARVRDGAGVEDLVSDFGLTRDEASLLVLLHAPKEANR